MFEQYQFEGLYIAIQAVLTLYAQGNWHVVQALRVLRSIMLEVSDRFRSLPLKPMELLGIGWALVLIVNLVNVKSDRFIWHRHKLRKGWLQ